MALDRDLEVAVAGQLGRIGRHAHRAWEMTAATGVRGLRYLHEGRGADRLLATESHPEAFEWLRRNCGLYEREGAEARWADARAGMDEGPFDFVDLDPYGSPLPFLGAALSACTASAVLAVTATDLRVLGGADAPTAVVRYGGRPPRGRLGPEGGLRVLLAAVDRAARAGGRSVTPLLAYVGDHHLRVYVSIGPEGPDPAPVAPIDPSEWTGPPLAGPEPIGPLWMGPLFDPELVRGLAVPAGAAHPRELGRLLDVLRGELEVDRPFFYESNEIAARLGLDRPRPVEEILAALRAHGFAAARTHARAGAFRTTATWAEVASVVQGTAGR